MKVQIWSNNVSLLPNQLQMEWIMQGSINLILF